MSIFPSLWRGWKSHQYWLVCWYLANYRFWCHFQIKSKLTSLAYSELPISILSAMHRCIPLRCDRLRNFSFYKRISPFRASAYQSFPITMYLFHSFLMLDLEMKCVSSHKWFYRKYSSNWIHFSIMIDFGHQEPFRFFHKAYHDS